MKKKMQETIASNLLMNGTQQLISKFTDIATDIVMLEGLLAQKETHTEMEESIKEIIESAKEAHEVMDEAIINAGNKILEGTGLTIDDIKSKLSDIIKGKDPSNVPETDNPISQLR